MPYGSCFFSGIQDHLEFIIKKHEPLTENPHVQIYPNKIISRVVFKTKTRYKLQILYSEKIKLFRSTIKDVDQDKDGEYVPKIESVG